MDKVVIYTDGACSGNPGPGGWGAVLLYKENRKKLYKIWNRIYFKNGFYPRRV